MRQCSIVRLVINDVVVSDPVAIMNPVCLFFSSLLGAQPDSGLSISPILWPPESLVSAAENADLMMLLSEKEIYVAVDSSKSNSAPGLDGFSVSFFKKFWPVLKYLVYAIIQRFCLGTVDISRLNYAVLTLIPKVKGADSIR